MISHTAKDILNSHRSRYELENCIEEKKKKLHRSVITHEFSSNESKDHDPKNYTWGLNKDPCRLEYKN